MKHIKTYENETKNYKVGDFVVYCKRLCKIEKVDKWDDNLPYMVKFCDTYNLIWINDICLRTATLKEIEQYKLEQEVDKYNL